MFTRIPADLGRHGFSPLNTHHHSPVPFLAVGVVDGVHVHGLQNLRSVVAVRVRSTPTRDETSVKIIQVLNRTNTF